MSEFDPGELRNTIVDNERVAERRMAELQEENKRLREELEGAIQQRDRNEVHGRNLKHENGALRKCVVGDVLPFLRLMQDKEEYPNDEAYALRLKLQRILGITKDWRDDIRKEPPH